MFRLIAMCLCGIAALPLVGCSPTPSPAWMTFPPNHAIQDRFASTEHYLETNIRAPIETIHEYAAAAALERFRTMDRDVIDEGAARAYLQQVNDGFVAMGMWFEFVPTVVEIEVWRKSASGDELIWTDGMSQSSMAANYLLLNGFASSYPVAVYRWIMDIDPKFGHDAVQELRNVGPDDRLFVRLIRASEEDPPLEAHLVMLESRSVLRD